MASLRFERLCAEAKQAFAQRDWAKAKEIYLQALTIQQDPDVHQGLASIYFQLKDLHNAVHHFRQVIELDPMRAGAYINLGAILNLLDELDDALAMLRRGIQLDPKRAEGFYNLGLVYRRKRQNDLAIQSYQEAIRVNPRMADAYYNMGNIYLEREDYRDAMRCYEEAFEARPGWTKAEEAFAQAEEALLQEEDAQYASSNRPASSALIEESKRVAIDPSRVIDPDKHGQILDRVHAETKQALTKGEEYQKHLLQEMEPAIKELSAALLKTGSSGLESAFQRFDKALSTLKEQHAKLIDLLFLIQMQSQKLAN